MGQEDVDWARLGDIVCEVLTLCLANRYGFEEEARQMGGTFEGFVAAAVVQVIHDELEASGVGASQAH